jgi:apolipoprotein N-acyltransferase
LRKIGRFFLPADINLRKRRLELTVWSFLLSLAFYPDYFGFLAWFSLVRPLWIISALRGREAFNAAYFFGFCFNAFSLYWVAMVTPPGTLVAVVIVSFYYAAVLTAFNRLYRFKPLLGFAALPFLWVGMEYFRTLSEFAFPWSDLGYTQSYYLYLIQIVSVVSVHGLSFLVVVVNVLLWQVFRKELSPERRLTSFFASAVVVIGLVSYGWIVVPKYPQPGTLDIAVLQGSVPLEEKWAPGNAAYTINLYDSLVRSVDDSSVALYVWPETAVPCYLTHYDFCRSEVTRLVRRSGAYHLIGALGAGVVDGEQRHFNSCFQIDPQGVVEKRYDKVKLVPFSEQVPYQHQLGFLRRDVLSEYLTFIETYDVQWWSDFHPGDSALLFELPDVYYGVLICFESTFPEYARSMIRKGAHFLVGITNDTWFGRSVGIHMHSRIFVTRAVENRTWAVRAANSGLSYIVDSYGRIRDDIPLYEATALHGKVGLVSGYSFFTEHGDIAGFGSFLILIGIMVILAALWIAQKLSLLRRF